MFELPALVCRSPLLIALPSLPPSSIDHRMRECTNTNVNYETLLILLGLDTFWGTLLVSARLPCALSPFVYRWHTATGRT